MMKVKVNRLLISGQYRVSFKVDQFTPEEVVSMDKFGVPVIQMKMQVTGGIQNRMVGITQITENLLAVFQIEGEAREYESFVMAALQKAIDGVRQRKDTFTGSDEVNL